MGVSSTTFRIALLVIIIVAILIITQSAWAIWFANRSGGDSCACSGVNDNDIFSLRSYNIFMLLIGIGILVYALVMLTMPGYEKRRRAGEYVREKFVRKDT